MLIVYAVLIGLIALPAIAFFLVIIASKRGVRSSPNDSPPSSKVRWYENPTTLPIIAIILSVVYGIIRLGLYEDGSNWESIGMIMLGCLGISILVKVYGLPGRVGIWVIFIFLCTIVTFDFVNLTLIALKFIDAPIIDWKSFVGLFEGNYLIWGIISLIAMIALCAKNSRGLAFLGAIALLFVLGNYSFLEQRSVNLYERSVKSTEESKLQVPLSDYPELYAKIDPEIEFKNFKSTKENTVNSLDCKKSGCYVEVDGYYQDKLSDGTKEDFDPAGNCKFQNRLPQSILKELPAYQGSEKPCYGALMYSTDNQTYKVITSENEDITQEELTRKIGKLKSDAVYFKFYVPKGISNGFGVGLSITTLEPKTPT